MGWLQADTCHRLDSQMLDTRKWSSSDNEYTCAVVPVQTGKFPPGWLLPALRPQRHTGDTTRAPNARDISLQGLKTLVFS